MAVTNLGLTVHLTKTGTVKFRSGGRTAVIDPTPIRFLLCSLIYVSFGLLFSANVGSVTEHVTKHAAKPHGQSNSLVAYLSQALSANFT